MKSKDKIGTLAGIGLPGFDTLSAAREENRGSAATLMYYILPGITTGTERDDESMSVATADLPQSAGIRSTSD